MNKQRYTENVMKYKSSLQIAKDWLKMGLISETEYKKLSAILVKKYDVNLCSLFAE